MVAILRCNYRSQFTQHDGVSAALSVPTGVLLLNACLTERTLPTLSSPVCSHRCPAPERVPHSSSAHCQLSAPLSVPTGVLLLNACLTVRAHTANSHKDQGWEQLTDAVVRHISDNSRGVVFLLWGAYAQKKAAAVDKVISLYSSRV
jgi:uracil DNA glycosylase